MKIFKAILIGLFFVNLIGCASVTKDIRVDAMTAKSSNLGNYKSYAWLGRSAVLHDPEKKWQPPKMDIVGDIRFLIDRELRKKGIYSSVQDPELAVTFFTGLDMEAMELKVDEKTKEEILTNVPKAALLVFLIDAETEKVVWIGKATAEVQMKPTDEVVRERLDYAVREMFKKLSVN
ncbi:MAG: DUF4136 domain-containing protein [Gammaproteobacteria bacterium]